jgi:hypothetical protein
MTVGLVSRHGDGDVACDAGAALDRASGGSAGSLPADLRERIEASLGSDQSGVRVHTDSAPVEAADGFGALAFAHDQDVYFGAGQYRPGTADGDLLIAHEVAHTVQQRSGSSGPQHKLEVSEPGDHLEVEADHAAAAMVEGRATELRGAGGGVQRQTADLDRARAEGAQTGVRAVSAAHACEAEERRTREADTVNTPPQNIPSTVDERQIAEDRIATQLAASFRQVNDSSHSMPDAGAVRAAVHSALEGATDLSQDIGFQVRAETGIADGRDDSDFHCILRFHPGAARLLRVDNASDGNARSGVRSEGSTTGASVGVNLPPVAATAGTAQTSGSAEATATTRNTSHGTEFWRMPLTADASWQRQDSFGRGNGAPAGWAFVRFGEVGHVTMHRDGSPSACPAVANAATTAPALLAAPAAVGAPALLSPTATAAPAPEAAAAPTPPVHVNVIQMPSQPPAAQLPSGHVPAQLPARTGPAQLPAPREPLQLPARAGQS